MKLVRIYALMILSSFLTIAHGQQPVPFSDKKWTIQAQGHILEPFRGFNSIYLQNGKAWLKDEQFGDGVIDFDIYLSPRTSFSGLIFRVKDSNNYEEIYLRSQQSGNPDAFQYTPVFNNDPAWQLYHDPHDFVNDGFIHFRQRGKMMGYNTVADYPFDRWMHVRLLVKGKQAELYFDNKPEPVAFIRELLAGIPSGGLGIKSGGGATWFANFTFTPNRNIEFRNRPDNHIVETPAGTISRWEVSSPFKENKIRGVHHLNPTWLAGLKWKTLDTEPSGLANLSRLSVISDSSNTVLAKFIIHSDKDRLKRLDLGYSDRVNVYCNGNAIYSGNTGFRSRDYRYLGTIGYFDAVYLPLKKGENIVIMAISENFGGWGLMAKLEDRIGLQ